MHRSVASVEIETRNSLWVKTHDTMESLGTQTNSDNKTVISGWKCNS